MTGQALVAAVVTLVAGPVATADPLTREGARDAARRELSKAVYSADQPSVGERVLHALGRWLDRLLSAAASAAPGGALGAIGLVALLILVVVVIRLRLGPLARAAAVAPPYDGGRVLTAAEHRAAAETSAAAGRYAEAVRERLRAAARELEQRGVLEPRAGRTADELASEAGRLLPVHAAALRRASSVFDEVWYGGRRAEPGDYTTVVAVDEAVRRASRDLTGSTQ